MPTTGAATAVHRLATECLVPSRAYQAWMEWPDDWAQLTRSEVLALPWTPRERQQIQQLWWFLEESLTITQ